MKAVVAALVAVIIWNGALTGVVWLQHVALDTEEAEISGLIANQQTDYSEIKKIIKVQNRTTKTLRDQKEFNDDTVKVIKEMVKVLSEPDAPADKPSGWKFDQSQICDGGCMLHGFMTSK